MEYHFSLAGDDCGGGYCYSVFLKYFVKYIFSSVISIMPPLHVCTAVSVALSD